MLNFIQPNWNAPSHIRAFTTLAMGGYSTKQYANPPFEFGLNLATHVGDNLSDVYKNRSLLNQNLPCKPVWLEQVHGTYCINLDSIYINNAKINIRADASFSQNNQVACCVMTADCIPLLVTNSKGTAIMAIHAGWKGINLGIIEKSLAYFMEQTKTLATDMLIWLAPSISKFAFTVKQDVIDIFMHNAKINEKTITQKTFFIHTHKIYADLNSLAKIRISRLDIPYNNITGGEFCTYFDTRFYSYRRNNITGRMASVIYIN